MVRKIRTQPIPMPQLLECKIKHIPLKRIFDILFSLGALILCSPLFFAVALVILLTSRGAVLFSHERVGRGGRSFKCYKFRTMYQDAEERLHHILESDPGLKLEWSRTYKLKDDPRVTPVGAFLRKTSLDELPQFWNVLCGDLSVVGPRPVVLAEVATHLGHKAGKILSVRPGLTGIWQVSGRSDTSYETRIRMDEEYIDNRSLFLDIWLIAKTIPAMISSKGAY